MCLSLTLFGSQATHALTHREMLDQYEGRWTGLFSITSFDGQVVKEIKVEQQYWWEGDKQIAFAVFDSDGNLFYSQSKIYIDDETLYSEITFGDEPPRKYVGRVSGQTITWLSTNVIEAVSKQFKESIIEKEGHTILRTEGFENVTHNDQEVTLIVKGELIKQQG